MPFRRTSRKFTKGKRRGKRIYLSPSGRKYSYAQVKAYYATNGFKRKPRKKRRRRRR